MAWNRFSHPYGRILPLLTKVFRSVIRTRREEIKPHLKKEFPRAFTPDVKYCLEPVLSLKVSIIIPCYNAASSVDECLSSVLNQDIKDCEIICVDNNSDDVTYRRLLNFQEKDRRIIVTSEEKRGASNARNKGLKLATGEWIQFLDADDLLLPNKISHQISLIEKHDKKVDLIAASCFRRETNGEEKIIHPEMDLWLGLFGSNLGNTCANLWRKAAVESVGGWDGRLKSSQEYELMFRMLKFGINVLFDFTPLTRIHMLLAGSISQMDPMGRTERHWNLRIRILEYLQNTQTEYFNAYKEKYYQKLFYFMRDYYHFSPEKVLAAFTHYLPKRFIPQKDNRTGHFYRAVFTIFGFRVAERIMQGLITIRNLLYRMDRRVISGKL